MSEYPIPWRALHSCILKGVVNLHSFLLGRSCKPAFLHPEEEMKVLIDLPQG
jgi:hypothetical protein